MNDCGAIGCDTLEMICVVDDWVASGTDVNQQFFSKVVGGKTIRTRPLCAYPAVAKYKGTGSMDEADCFTYAIAFSELK